jgi:uncharacterized membrane protein
MFGAWRTSGKMRDVIAAIIALVSLAWLLAIVGSPVLPAPLAAAVYLIGSHICHQHPDRSFHLFGAQLAVCARCTGIYAGALVGAAIGRWVWPQAALAVGARGLLIAGALPTAVTWSSEWAGIWVWSNVDRAVAGLPLGIAVGLVVMRTVATLHYVGCAPRPPIASNPPSIPI